jgi:hypothetical protein
VSDQKTSQGTPGRGTQNGSRRPGILGVLIRPGGGRYTSERKIATPCSRCEFHTEGKKLAAPTDIATLVRVSNALRRWPPQETGKTR